MKYVVMFRGKNFELNFDGVVKNLGFVNTRVVNSRDVKAAELMAVDMIRKDKNLTNMTIEKQTKESMIYLDEIFEAKW